MSRRRRTKGATSAEEHVKALLEQPDDGETIYMVGLRKIPGSGWSLVAGQVPLAAVTESSERHKQPEVLELQLQRGFTLLRNEVTK